jgi:hypothetical protein
MMDTSRIPNAPRGPAPVNDERRFIMEHTETEQRPFMGTRETHEGEALLMGGSLAETIAGAGAIVLSILGLVGILPDALLAVATIAIGGAFILESGSVASRFTWLVRQVARTTLETGEMAVGMTTEFVGGIAGIALGVLALLGLIPNILLPIAAIIFGFTLLFGIGVQARLSDLEMEYNTSHELARRVVREAVSASSGIQILFGLGAVTLGILSLVGIAPVVLTLVSMLTVGSATLFSGAAISARMWGFTRFHELPSHPATP